jgi:uncharacterized protein (AIM24 family)
MSAAWAWLRARFGALAALFAFADAKDEQRLFGLGQFVLLLTLAPFALSLTLFDFAGEQHSWFYRFPSERFTPFPPVPELAPDPGRGEKLRLMADWCESANKRYPDLDLYKPAVDCPPPLDLNPQRLARSASFCLATLREPARQSAFGNVVECNRARRDLEAWNEARGRFEESERARQKALDAAKAKKPEANPQKILRAGLTSVLGGTGNERNPGRFMFLMLASLCLYLPVAWICWRRRLLGLLAFGLAVPNVLLLVWLLRWSGAGLEWAAQLGLRELMFVVAPHVAFAWFALRGRIRSRPFGVALLLYAAVALSQAVAHNEPLLPALWPVLAFVLIAGLARLVVRAAVENASVLRNLGWARSLRTAGHALLLWLPMASIAVPYFMFTEYALPRVATNELHKAGLLKYGYDDRPDFRDNALASTAVKFDDLIFELHREFEKLGHEIQTQVGHLENAGLEDRARTIFDRVMPAELKFNTQSSDAALIGWAIDSGVDTAESGTKAAYGRLREEMKDKVAAEARKLNGSFQASLNKAEGKALEILRSVKKAGTDALLQANDDAQLAIWWQISYLKAAHQVFLVLFAFVCLKSFGYVFARIGFHRDTGTRVSLEPTGCAATTAAAPVIVRTGQQYVFPRDAQRTFFVSRRFQCRGKAPKFSMPQPLRAPLARLLHGAMSMNEVIMRPGDDAVSCTTTRGAEFLAWELGEGEQVAFDFAHFVAMSQGVRISTLISARLSTLLLGRFIFSIATGPGTLVLMTRGRAEIAGRDGAGESMSPERLVAMHAGTQLHVESELGLVDIYLSTAYVRPAGGGQVIVDVDRQQGSALGLARFLRNFVWPG